MGDFERAWAIVGPVEAGYVFDARDPGGETKYGISKRSYPNEDIKNLTPERAAAIAWTDFWLKASCTQLSWPLNLFVFDSAFNQGVVPAIEMLQKAANIADIDGRFGPDTLRAVQRAPVDLAALFMAERALRYEATKNATLYGRGWLKRLFVVTLKSQVA
jgi:lysozyme family protein